MGNLAGIFSVLLGLIHAEDQQYVTDVSELRNVAHIRSLPLYANLKENNIHPDSDGRYSLIGDDVTALPVGLDFQLLSVNAGMY